MSSPRLAVVLGEPGGIGAELCAHLAQYPERARLCTIFGSTEVIEAAARAVGVPLDVVEADAGIERAGQLRVIDFPVVSQRFGVADPRNADAVMAALHSGIDGCLAGAFDGLVTGPIQKSSLHAAGYNYTGTTEVLAARCATDVVMMLARDDLRVALVTTHLPLRSVPDAVTPVLLERTLRITHAALETQFGLADPHIVVLGLNPHAGEDGVLGHEEHEVIAPVLALLRAEGMRLVGPLPADTAFLPSIRATSDAVVAMYHDQGLPVLKSEGLDRAVNITLGLPFPRVAVDHGTALDIAGQGLASPDSFLLAIDVCASLVQQRITTG